MGIRSYKPTSPGRRFVTSLDFTEITADRPLKKLTEGKKRSSGRNSDGHITVRHRGRGHKRRYDSQSSGTKVEDCVNSGRRIEFIIHLAMVSYRLRQPIVNGVKPDYQGCVFSFNCFTQAIPKMIGHV